MLAWSGASLACAVAAWWSGGLRRLPGALVPAYAVVAAAGAWLALHLVKHDWPVLREGRTGLGPASGIAVAFAAIAIAVDRAAPLPADINVPWPHSVVVYPAAAMLVEVIMHLAPLAALLALARRAVPARAARWRITAMIAVALVEPAFQFWVTPADACPAWEHVWIGAHVLMINLAQLFAYRRWGLISMVGLRLVYYALWHIAWGWLRTRW